MIFFAIGRDRCIANAERSAVAIALHSIQTTSAQEIEAGAKYAICRDWRSVHRHGLGYRETAARSRIPRIRQRAQAGRRRSPVACAVILPGAAWPPGIDPAPCRRVQI